MKIYQLFLSLILIVISQCEKLNYEENQKRLTDCGKQMLEIPKEDFKTITFKKDQWITTVIWYLKIGNKTYYKSASGSFISPRHIITSSQTLMNDKSQWIWNKKKKVEEKDYVNGTDHLRVPLETIPPEYVFHVGWNEKRQVIKEAWILGFRNHKDTKTSPMLIELKNNQKVTFPCLARNTDDLKQGDKVSTYVWGLENGDKLEYRRMTIAGFHDRLIIVAHFDLDDKSGGPMVKIEKRTAVLHGISAFSATSDQFSTSIFYNMRNFSADICSLSGICDPTAIQATTTLPTTPATSTIVTPTTSMPAIATSPLPISSSTLKPMVSTSSKTTKGPITSTSSPPTSPPPHPTTMGHENTEKPMTDKEDEEEDEGYGDGEDFFVSEDFLNGSGKIGLNLVMTVLVMVLVSWS